MLACMRTADVFRIILASSTVVLGLLVLRVAFLRLFAPPDDPVRRNSGWGLLSYASFSGIAVYDSFIRFGLPLDPTRTTLLCIALLSGFYATGQIVQLKGRGIHPPGD